MGEANCYRWRLWERRADAIHRKAGQLLADMIGSLGTEHTATDFADNVVAEVETLCGVLARAANNAKSPGRRSPTPSVTSESMNREGRG